MSEETLRVISPSDIQDGFILHDGTIISPIAEGGWTVVQRGGFDGQRLEISHQAEYRTTNYVNGAKEIVVFTTE